MNENLNHLWSELTTRDGKPVYANSVGLPADHVDGQLLAFRSRRH